MVGSQVSQPDLGPLLSQACLFLQGLLVHLGLDRAVQEELLRLGLVEEEDLLEHHDLQVLEDRQADLYQEVQLVDPDLVALAPAVLAEHLFQLNR